MSSCCIKVKTVYRSNSRVVDIDRRRTGLLDIETVEPLAGIGERKPRVDHVGVFESAQCVPNRPRWQQRLFGELTLGERVVVLKDLATSFALGGRSRTAAHRSPDSSAETVSGALMDTG